jgi:pentatricopeptide repeat protein
MADSRKSRLKPQLRVMQATLSALIQVCVNNDQLERARGVYEEMRAQGMAPHHHAYNALINAYACAFHLGDAVMLVSDMVSICQS